MREITTQELIDRILGADSGEIFKFLDAVRERFSELYPDQELLTLAAPGSDARAQMEKLRIAASILSSMK